MPASGRELPGRRCMDGNGPDQVDETPGAGSAGGGPYLIDCLQYCQWSREVFSQLREGGVDAIHATVAYHGSFTDAVAGIQEWSRLFEAHADLVMPGRASADIMEARRSGRTAVFTGFQNPSPIGDDLGLVDAFFHLGIRFMQLTYNNQSLLASGYMESDDIGVTRMGREVIAEMNRLGMVIDMSHSGERSTLEAIEQSRRPVAVTHANPEGWHATKRNKSDAVISALAQTGGMLGFSIYPIHLKGGPDCSIGEFCRMVARTAEKHGVDCLGIGSDLCQGRPPSQLGWMRRGRWMRPVGTDDGDEVGFPPQPEWFRDNRDFHRIRTGLGRTGFSAPEIDAIMGGNWLRFIDAACQPSAGAV